MSNVLTVIPPKPWMRNLASRSNVVLLANGVIRARASYSCFASRPSYTPACVPNDIKFHSRRQTDIRRECNLRQSLGVRSFVALPRLEARNSKKPIASFALEGTTFSVPRTVKKPIQSIGEEIPSWKQATEGGQVFGRPFPNARGQRILETVQRRRKTGSLAEEGLAGLECSEKEAKQALDWLREQYPLDEETLAAKWAEAEAERLQRTYQYQAQRIGLFKKDAEYSEPPPGAHSAVDEQSVLVQRRLAAEKERKAREEEEERQRVEEEQAGKAKAKQNPKEPKFVMPWNNAELKEANKERRAQWKKLAEAAELKFEDDFNKRGAFSRLWAPTLFGATVIFLAVSVGAMYEPPRRENRVWANIPPAVSTCIMLATLNTIAFIMWRVPAAWYTMNRVFMLSAGHPNAFSIVGNLFSHQQLWHFSQNMLFLFLVGPLVHEDIGRGNFLALYLSAGVFGSLFNLYVNVLTRNFFMASLGASGSLLGLLGAFFMLEDRHQVRIPFSDIKFEFDSKIGLGLWVILEVIALLRPGRNSDHLSHLGGMFAGCIAGWLLKQRKQQSLRKEQGQDVGEVLLGR